MNEPDWNDHRRRVVLMRMEGATNRLERRMYVGFFVAFGLAVLSVLLLTVA